MLSIVLCSSPSLLGMCVGISTILVILKMFIMGGAWVVQSVKHLPLAQVMIPRSWDRVPHQAPCSVESLLLPPPAVLSLTKR